MKLILKMCDSLKGQEKKYSLLSQETMTECHTQFCFSQSDNTFLQGLWDIHELQAWCLAPFSWHCYLLAQIQSSLVFRETLGLVALSLAVPCIWKERGWINSRLSKFLFYFCHYYYLPFLLPRSAYIGLQPEVEISPWLWF